MEEKDKVNVYFVRHATSCSNDVTVVDSIGNSKMSHTPLTYKGIQEAINLGINNKIIDQDFDTYYCSPSLRTIMTACLALRSKSRKKKITLFLNPYLIEKQNMANRLDPKNPTSKDIHDRQNAVVPKQNLMNMINYIKLWFDQKYFDNYIDYEFVYLMYDLILLLLHHNTLTEIFMPLIKNLLDKNEKNKKNKLNGLILLINTNIDKDKILQYINRKGFIYQEYHNQYDIYTNILFFIDNLKLIEDNNKYIVDDSKFKTYEELNTGQISIKKIIEQLKLLTQDNLFMNNIEIDYSYKDNQEHNANIQKFITNEIFPLKESVKNHNILCFSHGSTLLNHFGYSEDDKLKNTEIIHYNLNSGVKKRHFNNNIIIDEELKDIDFCGDIKPQILKTLLSPFVSTESIENRMFKVIDNYFQNPKYKITTDNNIIEDFKVDILNESADIAARELEAKAIEVEILKTEVDSIATVLKDKKAKEEEARAKLKEAEAKAKEARKNFEAVKANKKANSSLTYQNAEKVCYDSFEALLSINREYEASSEALITASKDFNAIVLEAIKATDEAIDAAKNAIIEEEEVNQEVDNFIVVKQKVNPEVKQPVNPEVDDFELVGGGQYKNKYLKYKQKYFNLKRIKQLNF